MVNRSGMTYLLLLHQLGVGAVVDNILPKDGGSQHIVDQLGIYIAQLPIEDELIALSAQIHRCLLPKEDKREDITVLCSYQSLCPPPFQGTYDGNTNLRSALEEEPVWVHSVGYGAPDDGQPVEYHRGFVWVFEEDLVEDVENDRERHKCCERGTQHDTEATLGDHLGEGFFDGFEDSHVAVVGRHGIVRRGERGGGRRGGGEDIN
jgi:hypothetical protein